MSLLLVACGGGGAEDSADPVIDKDAGGPNPDIVVIPRTVDFGDIAPGTGPVSELVEIDNDGQGDLVLESLEAVDAPFSIGDVSSILVAPGTTTGFTVSFTPTETGEWMYTVEVRSNDLDQPVVAVSLLGRSTVEKDTDTAAR